jgi:hypothetical protein
VSSADFIADRFAICQAYQQDGKVMVSEVFGKTEVYTDQNAFFTAYGLN